MSVEYSIGVSNRFAQLLSDDEADPLEIIRESEKEKDRDVKKLKGSNKQDVKSSKAVKDQAKSTVSKKDTVNEEARKENRGDSRRGGRNQRGDQVKRENERNVRNDETSPGDDRRAANNRRRRDNMGSTGDGDVKDASEGRDSSERFTGERGRGRGRGGRGGRGGFPGRGGGRGGKREFERRSGSDKTSVKQDDKRGGGGSYNWGTPTDHVEEGEVEKEPFSSPQSVDWAETSPDPDAVTPAPADGTEEKEEGDVSLEEDVQEMSLEEWKQEQENQRAKLSFNIRKAGEGESKAQWKNTKVLAKTEEIEPLFAPKRIIEEKIKTSGRVLKHLDIDYQFPEAERTGEFRGGRRGRGRGDRGGRGRGRGRGGSRGGRGTSTGGVADDVNNLNFDNPEEFPSLE